MLTMIMEDLNDRVVYLAFINSEGYIEYSKYVFVDGGVISDEVQTVAKTVAMFNDIEEFQEFNVIEKD